MYCPNDCRRILKLWLVLAIALSLIATAAFNSSSAARSGIFEPSGTTNRAEQTAPPKVGPTAAATAQENYGKLSLPFEANQGQTDSQVQFITRASGATVFLTRTAAVFALAAPEENLPNNSDGSRLNKLSLAAAPRKMWALRMNIVGANSAAPAEGLDRLPGVVNYFNGNDSAKWRSDIPTYARVQYASIYPGVDMVYYGNQQHMEYDFVVRPGANASQIALDFEGASKLATDTNGDLLIETGVGTVRQFKPLVYQEVNGEKREVESGYELQGAGRVGFRLGAYDRAKPLVIDPVLAYSTYLSGGGALGFGFGIAVDSLGNTFISGASFSPLFPTTPGAFQTTLGGALDGVVMKLNPAGSALIYSTYLGGDNADSCGGIAIDSAGNAYVSGATNSDDFPTTPGALRTSSNGLAEGFVTKLNAAGTALVYSTYLGGTNFDSGDGIAVDSAGNAYVTGSTQSSNFPVSAGAFDPSFNGDNDAFVVKLNAVGSALLYSTYFGGTGEEPFEQTGINIVVDSVGNAYVAGTTDSTDFPTTEGAFDTTLGSVGFGDAFVAKINPNASGEASLIYSTYLGGIEDDSGEDIAIDSAGRAYITGTTESSSFPVTSNGLDIVIGGDSDAFVTKFTADGSNLSYSSYLGGLEDESGLGIEVDAAGNSYVTGFTDSTDFPVSPDANDTTLNDGMTTFVPDGFVTKTNASGSALAYSTYLGGNDAEISLGIAVDQAENIYLRGETASLDFPTTAAALRNTALGDDDFVTKIGDYAIIGRVVDTDGNPIPTVTVTLSSTNANSAITQTNVGGHFSFLNTTIGGSYTITPGKTGFTFSPPNQSTPTLNGNAELFFIGSGPPATPTPTPTPTPGPASVQFAFDNYIADEDCGSLDIAVTRSGDTATAATIDFATADDTAKQKGDYGITLGTISFAPGESNKIITVLITEDEFVEGDEQFTLNLFSPTGGVALAEPSRTTVTITDDDTTATNVNPIDDTEAFVCQHYHDFLNREPDTAGELFWINNIESCGTDAACRELKRTDTSAAFFLSIEFQGTGFYAIRLQRTAFGKRSDTAATRMTYEELVGDARQLGEGVIVGQPGADTKLAQNKQAYATQVVTSAAFIDRFPTAQTAAQYVDALYASAEVTPTATERTDAITAFGGGGTAGRVAALRSVVESQSIVNAEVNPAFVLLQYHGYLRRNPTDLPDTNDSGYQFWLTKLNSFGGDFRKADMVKAFITSAEYRQRFGEP